MRDVGLAIIGQTGDLVPADKRLYALRDVTATIDNVQLIAASIMSKKIAAGADAIVLDVKVGDGAFMKTLDDARTLAATMLELGERAGRRVACLLTDMDQPLGRAVGNALELVEARATLRGEGPPDFTELVLTRGRPPARVLRPRRRRGRGTAARRAGRAGRIGARAVRALDPGAGRRPERGRAAAGPGRPEPWQRRRPVASRRFRALAIGVAALELGAGRARKDDAIDHAVGIVCLRKRGDAVAAGEPLAEIHARDGRRGERRSRASARSVRARRRPRPRRRPVVLDVVA